MPVSTAVRPAPDPQADQSVRALAIELVVSSGNDLPAAAATLLKRLRAEQPAAYRQKADEALQFWAETEVRIARGGLRDHIIVAEAIRVASKPSPSQQSLRAFAMSWFDWPVLPGVLLRDATRTDLRTAAANYQRDAEVYLNRGGWLSALADDLPNDQVTVAQTLTEAAVAKRAAAFGVTSIRGAA